MESPKMHDCADGLRRADNGCLLQMNGSSANTTKGASYTLTAAETGKSFSNTAAITLTLPVPKGGEWYLITKLHDSTLTVAAGAGGTINGAASLANSTSGDTGKACLWVVALSPTVWITASKVGTWS